MRIGLGVMLAVLCLPALASLPLLALGPVLGAQLVRFSQALFLAVPALH